MTAPNQTNPLPPKDTEAELDELDILQFVTSEHIKGEDGKPCSTHIRLNHDHAKQALLAWRDRCVAEARVEIKINRLDAYQRGLSLGIEYFTKYHPELILDSIALKKGLARLEQVKGEYVNAIEELRELKQLTPSGANP